MELNYTYINWKYGGSIWGKVKIELALSIDIEDEGHILWNYTQIRDYVAEVWVYMEPTFMEFWGLEIA